MEITEIAKRIKHVVVMMMENRSFDHLFGYYSGVAGTPFGLNPSGVPQYSNLCNPPDPTSSPYPVWPIGLAEQTKLNPNHSFGGMIRDIYGPQAGGCLSGLPFPWPPRYYPNQTMCGFVSTNPAISAPGQASVMAAFKDKSLEVLHPLADHFVLCANWYCDTPSETVPNRHFVHLATNMGWNDSNPDWPVQKGRIPGNENPDIYNARTLYKNLDELAGSGTHWAMYGFRSFDVDGVHACSFDSDMYAYTNSVKTGRYDAGHRDIGCLAKDIEEDKLPYYTFINPSLNYPGNGNGNSMHPNSHVQYGENYVAHVYGILRASKIWKDTLFIVTFDENGGLYDHRLPPTAVSPDGITFPPNSGAPLFDYSRLGPRIPTLLISPWLQKPAPAAGQIDTTQYQNTSIPRFVQDLFAAIQGRRTAAPSLTERDRTAPSFAHSPFWREELPGEPPPVIPSYSGFDWYYPLQKEPTCEGSECPISIGDDAPAQDAIDLVLQYVTHLPGHPDSGSAVERTFASCRELWAYLQERNAAARQHRA